MTVMHDEGDLRITAVDSSTLRKFDDPQTHQALGPMKAVDFIIDGPQGLSRSPSLCSSSYRACHQLSC